MADTQISRSHRRLSLLIICDNLHTLRHIYIIGDGPQIWERPFKFYTVAQTFTQHLHYAEYLRCIKQVKLENTNAQINDIARPTDSRMIMRKEKQRQKESEALSAQQRAGLSDKGQRTTSRVQRSNYLPDYR
jgi:hypothetical protein